MNTQPGSTNVLLRLLLAVTALGCGAAAITVAAVLAAHILG
jgi:hypothetical protein